MQACQALLQDLYDYDPTPAQMQPVLSACTSILFAALDRVCIPVLKMSSVASVDFMHKNILLLCELLENSQKLSSMLAPQVLCQLAWRSLVDKAHEGLVRALKSTEVKFSCLHNFVLFESIVPTWCGRLVVSLGAQCILYATCRSEQLSH